MKNYLKGLIISTFLNKTKVLLIYYYKFNNKFKLFIKKCILYLIHDYRNECLIGDIILSKKLYLIKKSKLKYFQLLKIILYI